MLTAETIARALAGHRAGSGWMCRCPAHDDRTPSLSIRAGEKAHVVFKCHGGCEQDHVLAALRSRGLWDLDGPLRPFEPVAKPARVTPNKYREVALSIWSQARPARGTLVETYLRSRAITMPPPDALRVARLKHFSGGFHPAMVALVTNAAGEPCAIQRTFLRDDGRGKAEVPEKKLSLGSHRGGAVRLADPEPGGALLLGEGVETTLSMMQATGHAGWATLGTSGLKSVILPEPYRDIVILADRGVRGEEAAQICGARMKREGRRVRIARPSYGTDFNDQLQHQKRLEGAL